MLAFDILFCSSASMCPSLAIILPRWRELTFLHAPMGVFQSTPTMVNALIIKNVPFSRVSENEMLDEIISQTNYCDINSFPSSNNNILIDIDPDINNLIPNGLKNQCKCNDT